MLRRSPRSLIAFITTWTCGWPWSCIDSCGILFLRGQGLNDETESTALRHCAYGILRACAQLPPEIPGVVFVYSKTLPDADFFRLFLDAACAAQPDRLSRLVVAILCPIQTIFQRNAPLIFPNKQTQFLAVQPAIPDVLTSKFGGVVVPPR